MSGFDVREFFFWYGPLKLSVDRSQGTPWDEASEILANFKNGDFSQRPQLFDLCCNHREEKFSQFSLQLFFLTARDRDLELLKKYYIDSTDTQLCAIALFSIISMLGLSLADKFAEILDLISDVLLKNKILFSLKSLLTVENHSSLIGTVSAGELISSIKKNSTESAMFWFHGRPSFLGDIAIKMQRHMQVAMSIDPPTILGDGIGPTLLSAASGLECPVSYTTVMTLDKVKLVLEYVKAVSAMGKAMGGWKRGSKYFYGHEIV